MADELLIRTREYLRPVFDDADTLDIIVRVYANLEGMANYLVRQDKVRNLGQLRAFSTGFCGRISSFDWVDVGVGKEGSSGRKVRGESQLLQCFRARLMMLREPVILYIEHSSSPSYPRLLASRHTSLALIHTSPRENDLGRISPASFSSNLSTC